MNSSTNNHGHRGRLTERFNNAGLPGLQDYEIVELLLTYVIPRRDTKPIAKELLQKFKTISALIQADPEELKNIPGVGAKGIGLFSLFRETMAYCLSESFEKKSLISKRKDAEEYLRFRFGLRKDEFVAAIFMDNASRVIVTEELCTGTVNQCIVYPRTVIERALRHGAASIILAHNHPGGNEEPSEADWDITIKLNGLCNALDISLHDHLLIVKDKVVSLREKSRWPLQK
jgi:DNA repair protein RadC